MLEGDALAEKRARDLARLKEHNKKLREKGVSHWDRYSSWEVLETVKYRVDRENFLRYTLLMGGASWLNGNKDIPHRVREAIRRGAGIHRRGDDGELYKWMNWRLIGECADVFGIPMELLIDEDYYFSRFGIAGYRILCEVHRQKASLEELTRFDEIMHNERWVRMWYYTWYSLFVCRVSFYQGMLYPSFFSKAIMFCRERLGIPVGALVGKPLHTTHNAVGVYGELSDILAALGDKDCAFVAAVAKAVHDYKFGANADEKFLTEAVERLLRWYLDAEGKKEAEVV